MSLIKTTKKIVLIPVVATAMVVDSVFDSLDEIFSW